MCCQDAGLLLCSTAPAAEWCLALAVLAAAGAALVLRAGGASVYGCDSCTSIDILY